jgi:hypothetical protein
MLYAKHIHVLRLLSTIPAPIPGVPVMTHQQANAAFDHMFDYIHTHWGEPLTSGVRGGARLSASQKVECFDCLSAILLSRDELLTMLATLPPKFSEAIFPVAVARYMFREMRMPIALATAQCFKEFYRRYGHMITSG